MWLFHGYKIVSPIFGGTQHHIDAIERLLRLRDDCAADLGRVGADQNSTLELARLRQMERMMEARTQIRPFLWKTVHRGGIQRSKGSNKGIEIDLWRRISPVQLTGPVRKAPGKVR